MVTQIDLCPSKDKVKGFHLSHYSALSGKHSPCTKPGATMVMAEEGALKHIQSAIEQSTYPVYLKKLHTFEVKYMIIHMVIETSKRHQVFSLA